MAKKGDVTLKLPLLITRGQLAFPTCESLIEAGRSFSMNAIIHSQKNCDGTIIIVSQKNPEQDDPKEKDIFQCATLARITSFNDLKTFYSIRVLGVHRVKINKIKFENNFYSCDVNLIDDKVQDKKYCEGLVKEIISFVKRKSSYSIKNILKNIKGEELINKAGEFTDKFAFRLVLPLQDRYQFLEENIVDKRLTTLLSNLSTEDEISSLDKKIQDAVRDATEKNQKEYFLREKIRAIKEELGENEENSGDNILKKLEENPYPEGVKKKVKAELKRFEQMPGASLETALIKQYIDIIMDVPWFEKTEDNDDIANAQKILDEDHYGLKKIKERIVEYLAVKKQTKSLKAPILCFYGPPGVGKTSLGMSIARALNRKFFKAALGGISDEAEIRGHRRTYVGSMPGRIIQGLRRVKVRNPVFLLDELDKLGKDYKGDPGAALLEVLDPEQNKAFNDNYIEEPYDLSDVLFIGTANNVENIPSALRDRLELIELNSYTEIEKLKIAEGFLISKQLKINGLEESKITWEKDAIPYIISHYTREAGVRSLERNIAKIIRKAIVEFTKHKNLKSINIDIKKIKEYLGIEIFEDTKKEKEDQVGVVTGLAYTEFGGDILPIEVNYFKGKGNLVLTGNLGNVMKESANIALDYVKSRAEKYKINPEFFAENDIHVHVPEGAVPKDGPSAGVALSCAIISALTSKKVKCDVAMTGEVSLRGNAMPIGGLREKSLAALRSGIKTIVVPKENKKDVEELPKEVKDNLKIIYMTKVDDAVKVCFTE